MVEKDAEAGGSVGVCSDNIVVCGAIAEGTMIFLLILIIILIIGFSAAWSVPQYFKVSTTCFFSHKVVCWRLFFLCCQQFTQVVLFRLRLCNWQLDLKLVSRAATCACNRDGDGISN